MGLLYTPTLSWKSAKNKLVSQAKKSIFCIKSYQRKFGYFSHSEYFKLFDSMVKPILLHGAEIWGFELADDIERVHYKFCKDFLGVSISTNNCMALGECGRTQLCVYYYTKCVKYWLKLLHMPDHRFPKNCYIMLKNLDDNW